MHWRVGVLTHGAQQYLSIPVYTIFKNLTIILIVSMLRLASISGIAFIPAQAYGEVIWFGGRVTGLTFVSFILMVGPILHSLTLC